MRALVVQAPHIERILDGAKIWEIRGSRTNVREQIGLIRGGSGTIIGVCELIDCTGPLTAEQFRKNARKLGMTPSKAELLYGYYKKTYAWVLANPSYLRIPVPYNHPSGAIIWVRLESATQRAVKRALKR